MNNPAFDFLRNHKQVSEETEALVLKQLRGKIAPNELLTVFENGISGKYGKLYSADPQTLIGWVDNFLKTKNSSRNYLQTGLAPVTMSLNENWDWEKEANKCFNSFLNGVSETAFHRGVYDNMMLSGKIQIGAYMKYYNGPPETESNWMEVLEHVATAKQKVLKDVFSDYRNKGYSTVFFVKD